MRSLDSFGGVVGNVRLKFGTAKCPTAVCLENNKKSKRHKNGAQSNLQRNHTWGVGRVGYQHSSSPGQSGCVVPARVMNLKYFKLWLTDFYTSLNQYLVQNTKQVRCPILKMRVSKNATPKSSILIGFSIIFTIHFGGPPQFFGNIHMASN